MQTADAAAAIATAVTTIDADLRRLSAMILASYGRDSLVTHETAKAIGAMYRLKDTLADAVDESTEAAA